MKDLVSITVRLTEKDPEKLHSSENLEKLEMCAQAIEIGAAISFAINGLTGVEHKTFGDEKRMQVSFVFSALDQKVMGEFVKKFSMERDGLFSSFQRSQAELAKDGIEIETTITSIETLELPA
ncbi:MAG: hypothetical protein PXY39_05510 [archaeon]|nr:hypothetical protein [archaeon]